MAGEIRGQGTPWDPAAGWDHLEQGCSGGGRRSCFLLGAAQILGIAGLVDEKLGRKHVVDACEDGLEEACTFLSDHLIDEAQTASMVEDEKEFWSLDTQCRWGRVDACIEMTGEVDTHTWVFHEFELLACELGWAPSCAGFMAWIEKQVAMGSGYPGFDALAQSHIESLLDEEPSELVASEWASRSLDVGKAVLLGTDPALPRDWRAARALLSLSCGGENYEACFWLGWMWKEGIGGPGDEEKAGWYTDEAEKLRSSACSSAGGPACGFEFSPPEFTE